MRHGSAIRSFPSLPTHALVALALASLWLALPPAWAQTALDQLVFHGHSLDAVDGVAVHPGGEWVVTAGSDLALFARDPQDGTLTLSASYSSDQVGFNSLFSGTGLTWTSDGLSLLVPERTQLGVFALDPIGGQLVRKKAIETGVGGIPFFPSIREVIASPDGRHVYVVDTGLPTGLLAIFDRDLASGRLTYQSMLTDDNTTVDGLNRVEDLAFSPDGTSLYIASGAAGGDNGVARYSRDVSTGALSIESLLTSADVTELDRPFAAVVSPDGEQVYVACLSSNSVLAFSRNLGTGALSLLEVEQDGVGGVVDMSQPQRLALRPDGAYLTVLAQGDRTLVTFERDPSTGLITYVETVDEVGLGVDTVGTAPNAIAYSTDDASLYVPGTIDSSSGRLAVLASDPATGVASFVERLADDVGVPFLVNLESMALAPPQEGPPLAAPRGQKGTATQGGHLYVVGSEDTVTVLARDGESGQLSFLQNVSDDGSAMLGLTTLLAVTVSPDGRHVYASGEGESVGAVLERDPSTGLLTRIGTFQRDPGTDDLDFVFANDEHLYSATDDAALVFYLREPSDGSLTIEQTLIDGDGPIDGLNSPQSLALSPDGRHIYVAGGNEDSIVAFRRDQATGQLTFLDVEFEGISGVQGIQNVQGLALDSTGSHLYAVAKDSDALTVFSRDDVTGLLTFQQALFDGVDIPAGLADIERLLFIDDTTLAVGSRSSSSFVFFSRDTQTGLLTPDPSLRPVFLNTSFDRMLLSPDGRHIISLHTGPDALSVHTLADFYDGFESGDTSGWSTAVP